MVDGIMLVNGEDGGWCIVVEYGDGELWCMVVVMVIDNGQVVISEGSIDGQ